MSDWRECDVFVRLGLVRESGRTAPVQRATGTAPSKVWAGHTHTLPSKRQHKSVIVSRSPCVSQFPMATNGSAHKFNKNENNWLHTHFEPQQVDVVVPSGADPGFLKRGGGGGGPGADTSFFTSTPPWTLSA